jgi:hypothetical protein
LSRSAKLTTKPVERRLLARSTPALRHAQRPCKYEVRL